MSALRLDICPYGLRCAEPALVYFPAGVRKGFFLRMEVAGELYGMGEYAPLSGIHHHTMEQAIEQIQRIGHESALTMLALGRSSLFELIGFFDRIDSPLSYLLSMIHFHHRYLYRPSPRAIRLSALITSRDDGNARRQAQRYLALGYRRLKVKIGGRSLKEIIATLKGLALIARGRALLRLDANRQLSPFEFEDFLDGVRALPIEYIEEPLMDIWQASHMARARGMALAIDESFAPSMSLDIVEQHGIGYLVIKPSRFKSVYHAISLAEQARRRKIIPIFSHCFESEWSCAINALIIHRIGLAGQWHGISARDFFYDNPSSHFCRAVADREAYARHLC